ncbi:MAG: M20 family metallopeptidase [Anaerolineales bacterium]|nr:M20 family metallopeptidase [Anaerolineales bacterium]
MSDLVSYFEDRTPQMLALLEQMVRHESPTSNKLLVDQFGRFLHEVVSELGADIEVLPRETVGDIRLAKWNADAPGKPLLLLMHIDTVWPEGTLANEVPLRLTDTSIHGPGALDMKGGILVILEAIRGLRACNEFPNRPIWMLLTSDEEVASTHSRELIQEIATQAGLVIVPEPAGEGEAIKSSRKGIGRYWIRSEGLASHSGNAPEAGINAIIDNAQQALILHDMNDLPNGTSVSITQIKGGTAMNVIPAFCELYADVRFTRATEAERIHQQINDLEAVVPGAKVVVKGWIDRPPLERNDIMLATVKQAKAIAESLGLPFSESFSGGGSDGNFTGALGIPTLDGMGPEGAGMHAAHEHVLIRSIPRRAAFIAAIIRDWQMAE